MYSKWKKLSWSFKTWSCDCILTLFVFLLSSIIFVEWISKYSEYNLMIVVNNIVWKQEEMINLWTQHRKQIKVISEENLWTQCEWNCHHWEKTYIFVLEVIILQSRNQNYCVSTSASVHPRKEEVGHKNLPNTEPYHSNLIFL